MIYKINCPWSEIDGAIEQAKNMADAASIFCTRVYGSGWSDASVNETHDKKSAIVVAREKRPFRIDIYDITNNDTEIESKNITSGKIKIFAISVSKNGIKSIGFVATPKSATVTAHRFGADKKTLLRILNSKGKVGFVDVVGDRDSLEILKNQMISAGAKNIVLR